MLKRVIVIGRRTADRENGSIPRQGVNEDDLPF